MVTPASLVISGAVEGPVDEAVLRVLLSHFGKNPAGIYGKNGKPDLRKKINAYNQAGHRSPWIVLVDLNRDADCAPALRAL